MSKLYESTRDKAQTISPTKAILQGLSKDGGLFVLRDLNNQKLSLDDLVGKDYYGIAEAVIKLFVDDVPEEDIKQCVERAYKDKFSTPEITPLVKLSDAHVLELFHGPTSAFKDIGLSMLPQLTTMALRNSKADYDILILTATSGDTGIAALEGFKNIPNIKIMVFYPKAGVSKVQETQMKTLAGDNLKVCAIEGNFDDAQSGIKKLFVDEAFKAVLANENIQLSSANSINIGRLIPQIVYYVYAYMKLLEQKEITKGEAINFVVPTGNFGNILAGYYAKQLGLPIHKLICASNENNVLYDFMETGTYNRQRQFLKTISPSMDILISSNLERLLYYVSGCDNAYVKQLMEALQSKGSYTITPAMLDTLHKDFAYGFASNEDTAKTIQQIYEKDHYLLDPHTAVAYKVLLDDIDTAHKNVVLSTASPYKFTDSVYHALYAQTTLDEFALMDALAAETQVPIPNNLKDLEKRTILHEDEITKDEMKAYVLEKLKEF